MRSALPAILASLGMALLAGCASGSGPAAANDRGPPQSPSPRQSVAPQPERGTVSARMNGQFGWYGAVASGVR
jgi:hypothetical protein